MKNKLQLNVKPDMVPVIGHVSIKSVAVCDFPCLLRAQSHVPPQYLTTGQKARMVYLSGEKKFSHGPFGF
jgi:hypothetical protein